MSLFRYRVHGLTIDSDIALPELDPADDGTAPDVAIRTVPALPERQAGDVHLAIPDVADFLVRAGTTAYVSPAADVPDRNLRVYLLGSVIGALLHQRGLVPLHANAIMVGRSAIAFAGDSGAGKSTLAAWAHDRGHDVLADDVSVVGTGADGPFVLPGLRRLRLWRDALERSGRDPRQHPQSYVADDGDDTFDKFDLHLGERPHQEPQPLGVIAILREGPLGVIRMPPLAAAEALFANTYRGYLVTEAGLPEQHFRTCLALVGEVPVLDAAMPRDAARYDAIAGEILERVAVFS